MAKFFRSVMFGGRDLLMSPDAGASGGHGNDDDSDDNNDEGDDNGGNDEGDGDGDEGDGDGEDGDDPEPEPEADPLDVPLFSKRQVANMISGRVNDVKKQYSRHSDYQDVAQMIGEIIGSPDFDTVITNIKQLHAQHRQKNGQPPVVQQYSAQSQAETKRAATTAEFDNSFSKKADYPDASLFRDEIIDMTLNGFSMEQAYWAVAGPVVSAKKVEAAVTRTKQVEQNKQKQNKHKQVVPGATGNPGKTGKAVIPNEIKAMAEKIGMDPEEYMAWSNVTN